MGGGDVPNAPGGRARLADGQAAYGQWLDQTNDRVEARQARIHGAAGSMPAPLWFALFFISAVIFVYLLFFADSGERRSSRASSSAVSISVIVVMLLLLHFLDDPYQSGVGGLKPVAMERSLVLIDQLLAVVGGDLVRSPATPAGNTV